MLSVSIIPQRSPLKFASPAAEAVPFDTVEQAWFWFMLSCEALTGGARLVKEEAKLIRPCEPIDILHIVNRLYRQRCLKPDHLRVLAHYGRKLQPPNPFLSKEVRSCAVWQEAMNFLEPILRRKKIIL